MRLLAITSNRICFQNAGTYLVGLSEFEKRYEEEIKLAIIGDGRKDIDSQNNDGAKKISELYRDRFFFIHRALQVSWIDRLINSSDLIEKDKIRAMLNPPEGVCSYGAVLNRLFLIAVSNGIEFIHKRDSDTQLNVNSIDEDPLLIEAKYLGKRYSLLNEDVPHPNMNICFVGGNYTGDPPADLMPFFQKDPMLFYRYCALTHPSNTLEEVIELEKSRYFGQSNTGNGVILVDEPIIELGNCSYYKIFRKYPVSCARDTMGTDYFIQDLLSSLNLSSLFHPKTVTHIHDQDRKTTSAVIAYHLRFPAFKIYNYVLHFFYKKINEVKLIVNSFDDLPSNVLIGEMLINHLNSYENRKEFRDLLKELISIYIESNIPEYLHIGEDINSNSESIINKTFEEMYDFALLLSQWHKLIEAAESIRFEIQ